MRLEHILFQDYRSIGKETIDCIDWREKPGGMIAKAWILGMWEAFRCKYSSSLLSLGQQEKISVLQRQEGNWNHGGR